MKKKSLPAVGQNSMVYEEEPGTRLSFYDNYIKQFPSNSERCVKAKQLTVPSLPARNVPDDLPHAQKVLTRSSLDSNDLTLESPPGARGHAFHISQKGKPELTFQPSRIFRSASEAKAPNAGTFFFQSADINDQKQGRKK